MKFEWTADDRHPISMRLHLIAQRERWAEIKEAARQPWERGFWTAEEIAETEEMAVEMMEFFNPTPPEFVKTIDENFWELG